MRSALALQIEEMTINEALADAVETLLSSDIESARLDARLLLAHTLNVSREYLTMHAHAALAPVELMAFRMLVDRRADREPMAQILGKREFWSLNFRVTSDTLDPRPDSETLIEAILAYVPKRDARLMVADFGTGTGCLLLSLLSEYPNAHGLGLDISHAALEVAEANACDLGLETRAHFHHSNWGHSVIGSYDIIVSNPPYIAEGDMAMLEPEVTEWEPKTALVAGADGLQAYIALMPDIKRMLSASGIAALELGMGQAEQVGEIARNNGLRVLEVRSDLAGTPRCVVISHA